MAEPRTQSDIAVTSARDLSGTIIGRFVIRELLGKGGMGEVYRASDLRLKREVALKRIAPHLRGDKRSRERFWKEAEWASRLSDPHIAAVHDVIDEENELFIVMEYVEGQTLRRRLTEPISAIEFWSRKITQSCHQCGQMGAIFLAYSDKSYAQAFGPHVSHDSIGSNLSLRDEKIEVNPFSNDHRFCLLD